MEIERKYLVSQLPFSLDQFPYVEIEQHYLCTSPTLRIRRMGDHCVLTVKQHLSARLEIGASAPIINREEEFDLPQDSFDQLRAKCEDVGVFKTRYRIPLRISECDGLYCGLTAELDLFHGRHEGLCLVEVEFPDAASAATFLPPAWFGKEVSHDPRFRNAYLAHHTL